MVGGVIAPPLHGFAAALPARQPVLHVGRGIPNQLADPVEARPFPFDTPHPQRAEGNLEPFGQFLFFN